MGETESLENEKGKTLAVMVAQNHPESLLKHRFPGQRICISNKFPCEAEAAVPGITLRSTVLEISADLAQIKTLGGSPYHF